MSLPSLDFAVLFGVMLVAFLFRLRPFRNHPE